ncbi:MAG: AAA family ATPase [Microgenomates group bacterium]
MDPQAILEQIFNIHVKQIRNLDKKNQKFLVLFSGITGSGKSYIAKKLEEKYEGIRINNDDIRDIIENLVSPDNNDNKQKILLSYLAYLLEKLPKSNGFIILDSSIDRKFEFVQDFAIKNNFKLFTIRIDLPREIIIKNILRRTEREAAPYLSDLDRQINDHQAIIPKIAVDFAISEDNFNRFSDLFSAIDRKFN